MISMRCVVEAYSVSNIVIVRGFLLLSDVYVSG